MLSQLLKNIVLIVIFFGLILFQPSYYQDQSVVIEKVVEIPVKDETVFNDFDFSVVDFSTPNIVKANTSSTIPVVPLEIIISTIDVDHSILEYTDEMVIEKGGVYPVSWNSVAWWSGGGRPGTTLDNTVDIDGQIDFTTYLYGHSTNYDSKKIIFDDIDLLKSDDEIIIITESGQFTYLVEEVFIIAKTDLMTDERATKDIPGRLLLISCWRSWSGSGITTDNVVVIANLINYVPSK